MRLCVVSLNPALDAEWRVEDVLWEEKNVVRSQRRWPGGKGVNVARWLNFLEGDSQILIPLGGASGRELRSGLKAWELRAQVIPLAGDTRVNVVVTTARGRQMRFNPPGPEYSGAEWRAVVGAAKKILAQGAALILSGALPPGLPSDAYTQLIRLAHQAGQPVILDCDGDAFTHGAAARPGLVKPNLHELERWFGRRLPTLRAAESAAAKLSATTQGWVLLSLGAEGALLINARASFRARAVPPRGPVLNTVGAGDAMLAAAAFGLVQRVAPEDWLRAAVGAGTAATRVPAGELPSRRIVRESTRGVRLL